MIQANNEPPRFANAIRRWLVPLTGLAAVALVLLPMVLAAPGGAGPAGSGATETGPPAAGALAVASTSGTPVPSRATAAASAAVPRAAAAAASSDPAVASSGHASAVPLARPVAATVVPSDGKRHMVDIGGGRRLAIWCVGTGSPTVILEHGIGYGIDSDSWPTVQNGIGEFTRVCRYDRAFTGFSDDAKSGRSMPDLAADLHLLLRAAGLPGPYVLVGHSFGGLTVRYYALRYPKDVSGMVLVDGSAPYAIEDLNLGSERLNHARVMAQLNQLKSLGSIPLVVITRGIGAGTKWKAAQAAMVKLSTQGRHVVATKSDHWIQLRQPDVVIRQVQTVVNTIRRHG